MTFTFIDWKSVSEIESELIFEHSNIITKICTDEYQQLLNFIITCIQEDRNNVKEKVAEIITTKYINNNTLPTSISELNELIHLINITL